ncbi:MAG: DinB family protein [Candidatus Dormibacteraeota bacterium]|nr:DinB family protein [Candidatus Dormibacteraeota bacterium]
MNVSELLQDAFDRIQEEAHQAVTGLSREQLAARPGPDANSIAWLVWHLTRVQDDHVSEVAGRSQTWVAAGWVRRFGLPFGEEATGYGQTSDQVGQVQVDGEELLGYLDATAAATKAFLSTLTDSDLDRVVDRNWTPAVTLGVRLVSVVSDDLQHVGQAAYVRGLLGA